MPYEFGEVVLMSFPFTDQSASKRRPAFVVSNRAYNMARPDVVVMAVTSQIGPTTASGGVWISQWQQAGLLKPSAVKPVFATIEQRVISRKIGTLQPADQAALKTAITEIIG